MDDNCDLECIKQYYMDFFKIMIVADSLNVGEMWEVI